jgi:hypothetical protein
VTIEPIPFPAAAGPLRGPEEQGGPAGAGPLPPRPAALGKASNESAEPPRQEGGDQVAVSSAARDLASADGEPVPVDTGIAPELLRQIELRLGSGFYRQPEVVAELAERVGAEIREGRPEAGG